MVFYRIYAKDVKYNWQYIDVIKENKEKVDMKVDNLDSELYTEYLIIESKSSGESVYRYGEVEKKKRKVKRYANNHRPKTR